MRRIATFIFLVLALSLSVPILSAQDSNTSAAISDLERPIHACEQQVASWWHEEVIEIICVAAVAVFGGVVASIRGVDSKAAKTATVVLGIATVILTGLNARLFTADDRTLRYAVFEGKTVISHLWVMLDTMKDQRLSVQDRLNVKGDYLKKLLEFQAIGERLNGTTNAISSGGLPTAGGGFGILQAVYAQSTMTAPPWAQTPPSDATSLYFIGKANDTSLTVAKQNSLDDAYHNAVVALRTEAPNASDAALLTIIKGASVLQGANFTYDRTELQYTCYTLLRVSREVQGVGIRSLPAAVTPTTAPVKFQKTGWQPGDMTYNPTSGLFVLDSTGGVSKLVSEPGPPRIEGLFRLSPSGSGLALTASAEAVFVVSVNKLGCTVNRYFLANRTVSQRLVAVHERCAGIATDGTAFYVSFPDRNEIRYWDGWDASSSHTISLKSPGTPGFLAFDASGHRLVVADASGSAYVITLPDGKQQVLSSDLGSVQSIATSRFYFLMASGKKILFIGRFQHRGENPPAGLGALTGGNIVGVAVDAADRLWFADYDKKVVIGPFPLS